MMIPTVRLSKRPAPTLHVKSAVFPWATVTFLAVDDIRLSGGNEMKSLSGFSSALLTKFKDEIAAFIVASLCRWGSS